jgi:hypothetical protein
MRYVISDEKEENRSMTEEEKKNRERIIEALHPNLSQQRPIPRPDNAAVGQDEESADKKD